MAAHANAPAPRHLKALKEIFLAAHQYPRELRVAGFSGSPSLVCFSDAAFDLATYSCRLGYKMFLVHEERQDSSTNCIAWQSQKPKRKVASSTAAELLGLELLVKAIWSPLALIHELWGVAPSVHVYVDSEPLMCQLETGKCTQEPRMRAQLDYGLQNVREMNGVINQIPSSEQEADHLTKLSHWW
eukprot:GHVU01118326.1.p1 GENE.GHVU01118326.1~~GHVU01118326.1.p1  ORF type:complete len:186 (+),score=14.07 GHVU01118326.1:429-986(+)